MDRVSMMREARTGPHRYQLLYLNVRSRIGPDRLIAVFEGREDVPIYSIWFARELAEQRPEPLEVNGKANVVALARLLFESDSARADKVVACIDHDFDGVRDAAGLPNVYVTGAYSIENLLVSGATIDQLLIVAFGATGDDQHVRPNILDQFNTLLNEFNQSMLLVNAHARCARLERVAGPGFPDRVDSMLDVTLDGVVRQADTDDSQVCVKFLQLSASPLPSVINEHIEFLKSSDLTVTGRGKFLFDFVRKFVARLYDDRRAAAPRFFSRSVRALPDPCQGLLVALANAGPTPPCFQSFIKAQRATWALRTSKCT